MWPCFVFVCELRSLGQHLGRYYSSILWEGLFLFFFFPQIFLCLCIYYGFSSAWFLKYQLDHNYVFFKLELTISIIDKLMDLWGKMQLIKGGFQIPC